MISSLTDWILLGALGVTCWRTVVMARELRRLRAGETVLAKALKDADEAINRAAHAVLLLRDESVETLRGLEARIVEARAVAGELDDWIRVADRKLSVANDGAAKPAAPTQDTWLSLIESRLASGSPTSR
jgi:hypothetical protein